MVMFRGRSRALVAAQVALVVPAAAGCGATHAAHQTAAATPATSHRAAPQPATPSVPTLTGVPHQGSIAQAAPGRAVQAGLLRTASLTDVPETALSAYQRAAQVIDAADTSCRLSWTLLAALGQVESDHGDTGDVTQAVARTSTATQPILGPVLNGHDGRTAVPDTDGGRLDGNTRWDRAVGPMQLLPSTWAEVAVDADGDGKRDPQDIDDAALGAAVYLCGSDDDLATRAGKRSAVFRYNHSRPYVLFVVALSHQYALSEQTLSPMIALRSTSATGVAASGAGAGATPVAKPATQATLVTRPTKSATVAAPSAAATSAASAAGSPTAAGTDSPTASGTGSPTDSPTGTPTGSPTGPTPSCPTDTATASPSASASTTPTADPTCPTSTPTGSPTSSSSPSASSTP